MEVIQKLFFDALKDIEKAQDLKILQEIRAKYLGKKGKLTSMIKSISKLPLDEKPLWGEKLNSTKKSLNCKILKKEQIIRNSIENNINKEVLDITLPGIGCELGSLHPITTISNRIKDFFRSIGFSSISGPEIEDVYYNFEALNIHKYHPARTMHDTFYLEKNKVLRTHTSGVQIRTMLVNNPPISMVSLGKVYRCDSDVTHTPMFHQMEGLFLDKNVSFSDLKGLLNHFLSSFFNMDIKTRFRPSYFPFTEPSSEIDIQCMFCLNSTNKYCKVCKNSKWIEVLGCGMVHPNVLKRCKIDKNQYNGFAFGIGIERLTMLYYEIDDLRRFFQNDLHFLKQF